MARKIEKMAVLEQLRGAQSALSLQQISQLVNLATPERTLRRWLAEWVDKGVLLRTGKKRGTRYTYSNQKAYPAVFGRGFLKQVPVERRAALLEQIRDLWTHSSTALEGNTLSLGDTHAILGLGLTVSGKPLREHQEVIGHARAIDLLYDCIHKPLNKERVFDLHRAIQTDIVYDTFKPNGAWKLEPNGVYAVTSAGEQAFIEYADPKDVDGLMDVLFGFVNGCEVSQISLDNAARYYAKIHMGVVHVHPFWDGNGRIARLLANIPLMQAGLPPLVIDHSLRREYIVCLADYQLKVGRLDANTGVWPDEGKLSEFSVFCHGAYAETRKLVQTAIE